MAETAGRKYRGRYRRPRYLRPAVFGWFASRFVSFSSIRLKKFEHRMEELSLCHSVSLPGWLSRSSIQIIFEFLYLYVNKWRRSAFKLWITLSCLDSNSVHAARLKWKRRRRTWSSTGTRAPLTEPINESETERVRKCRAPATRFNFLLNFQVQQCSDFLREKCDSHILVSIILTSLP